MSKLEQVAKKYRLAIVEDLAHSAGRFYPDGREVGTVGVAAALSFGKGKAIDTIEGGAVIVRNGAVNQPLRRPKLSDRLRDRWYPLFGAMIRGLYHLGLGKMLTGMLLKLHWIQRSADAELDTEVSLSGWQAQLAMKQLAQLPKTALREFKLVRDREQLLIELKKQGYFLDEIWYDSPVAPARYAAEAAFPKRECPITVEISQQIINLPTWYSEKRLAPVHKIIQPYLITEEAHRPQGQTTRTHVSQKLNGETLETRSRSARAQESQKRPTRTQEYQNHPTRMRAYQNHPTNSTEETHEH